MRKHPSFKKTCRLILTFFSCFILLLEACTTPSKNKNQSLNQIALPVYNVDTGTVVLKETFLGTVEGKINVEIRPQVTGELEKSFVDEGSFVEKGQTLFRINPQTYQQDLNRAKANENVEKAKLANAALEVEKLKPLVENEVISPVRLKTARSNYEVAEANLKQAAAEVANAKIQMGYTYIKAPVSGYIGRIPKRIGNVVSPGDKEPITALTDVHEVYVYFSISESSFYQLLKKRQANQSNASLLKAAHLDSGRVVTLILSDGTEYPEKGIIDGSSGQIDKNTGSITLRATFPNYHNMLRSGNTGNVIMKDIQHGKIIIPQKATYELQATTFVEKLTPDNKVVRQAIEIESLAPNNQYTVKKGLKRGDRILVEGQDKVSDSMSITPMPYQPDTLYAPQGFQEEDSSFEDNDSI